MNHSCIATINNDGISLSGEVLTPLGISHDTQLWGMYYPRPNYGEQFGDVGIEHDFVITPVPYPLWPYAARIKLRILLDKTDFVIDELTEFLAGEGVQLLAVESSRSAHRYATVTMTIAFGKLRRRWEHYEGDRKSLVQHAGETKSATKSLLNRLRQKFAEYLFSVPNMESLADPVGGGRLEALAYFFVESRVSIVGKGHAIKHRVFELTCNRNTLALDRKGQAILEEAIDLFPTRGFAEMETRDVNIRIAVIERKQLEQFASVRFSYKWHMGRSDMEKQRPILADILRPLKGKHLVWRLVNHYQKYNSFSEIVTFDGVVQCSSANPAHWKGLEMALQSVNSQDDAFSITEAFVNSFSFFRVFLSLKSEFRFDDIVNCCHEVGGRFGMMKEDFLMVKSNVKQIPDEVVQQIKSSNAMIQYYGTGSRPEPTYEWLSAELLAAAMCKIPVVIIKEKKVPREYIKTIGGQAPIVVPDNPGINDLRSAFQVALEQLTEAVLSRRDSSCCRELSWYRVLFSS